MEQHEIDDQPHKETPINQTDVDNNEMSRISGQDTDDTNHRFDAEQQSQEDTIEAPNKETPL